MNSTATGNGIIDPVTKLADSISRRPVVESIFFPETRRYFTWIHPGHPNGRKVTLISLKEPDRRWLTSFVPSYYRIIHL